MKKNFSVILLSVVILSFAFIGCAKKSTCAVTLKCGTVTVRDGNNGGSLVAQSPVGCYTDAQISVLETTFSTTYTSGYDISFNQTGTQCQ